MKEVEFCQNKLTISSFLKTLTDVSLSERQQQKTL